MATSVLILQNIKKFLTVLGEQLRMELIRELKAQNHKATGKLIESIESSVQAYTDRVELSIMYNKYGIWLEKGIKPSDYKRGPSRAEIRSLMNWLKVKHIVQKIDKKTESFAWAIAKKHRKRGFPLASARKFSPSGRILRFQTIALRKQQQYIETAIQNTGEKTVNATLDDIINKIQKRY